MKNAFLEDYVYFFLFFIFFAKIPPYKRLAFFSLGKFALLEAGIGFHDRRRISLLCSMLNGLESDWSRWLLYRKPVTIE